MKNRKKINELLVPLKRMEVLMLVRCLRQRSYDCRLLVLGTHNKAVQRQARVATLRCDNRADELAELITK